MVNMADVCESVVLPLEEVWGIGVVEVQEVSVWRLPPTRPRPPGAWPRGRRGGQERVGDEAAGSLAGDGGSQARSRPSTFPYLNARYSHFNIRIVSFVFIFSKNVFALKVPLKTRKKDKVTLRGVIVFEGLRGCKVADFSSSVRYCWKIVDVKKLGRNFALSAATTTLNAASKQSELTKLDPLQIFSSILHLKNQQITRHSIVRDLWCLQSWNKVMQHI